MANIEIVKQDGTSTGMFWTDTADAKSPLKRVFRRTDDGRIQRSKSLRYDTGRKSLQRV